MSRKSVGVNRGDGISMVQRKHKVINWNNNGMRNDVFPFAPLNGTFALAANFTVAYLNSVNRIILNICKDNTWNLIESRKCNESLALFFPSKDFFLKNYMKNCSDHQGLVRSLKRNLRQRRLAKAMR